MTREHGRAELLDLGGYWGRLSDEELLGTTFTTADPEGLPKLCMEVPPEDDGAYIEYAYDMRGTKHALIYCVHCKHPTHKAGFVVRISDGRRFLVGKNCGAKIYGAHFDTKRREFDTARNRALLLRRTQRLNEALPNFLAYLHTLRSLPAIECFGALRRDLYAAMPRLCGELQIACLRHNGELLVATQVRDFQAEDRAQDRYERALAEWQSGSTSQRKKTRKPEPPKLPITKPITERIGYVSVPTFFTGNFFRAIDLNAVIAQFENLAIPTKMDPKLRSMFSYRGKRDAEYSDYRSSIVSMDMAENLKQANVLLDVLEDLIGKLCEPIRLFHRPALESLCRWANKHGGLHGAYAVADGALRFVDHADTVHTVRMPREFVQPSADGIAEFRKSINLEQ